MKLWPSVGTRSVLFGVHAFWWHFLTVGLAWRRLYKEWPTWQEWVCIFVHDLGYWGKPNLDGPEGRTHPELGAMIAKKFFQPGRSAFHYYDLTLYHSREYAKMQGEQPSKLCWADKYAVWCEPGWFYLLRGRLSGEIKEFKANAPEHVRQESDRFWFTWYQLKVRHLPEIRKILDHDKR